MAKENINGVAYNTKTAETIAHNGSGKTINHSDERWFTETLYRKKSGEFFLYGSGGIFTKYAKQTGPDSWERSEAILPLTEDEAKQWAMNNLGDDGYKDVCQRIEEKPHEAKTAEEKPAPVSQNNDNKRIEKILAALRKQPNITQRELAKETKMSLLKVNTILQHLRADGKIIREGTSKKGSWIIAGEEPNTSVITVYGTHTCPDCSFIEDQIKDDDGFRFVDIGSHVKNLKAFMALRDSDPVFNSVKNKGIGIPAFVHEDVTVTLIPEDVGLKSRQEALLEQQRKEEAQEVAKKSLSKSSRKAASSVQTAAAREANTKKIIGMIKKNPSVSQADFQKATNLSRMQVVTILNHLKDDGKLEHTGSKRAGQWVLKK